MVKNLNFFTKPIFPPIWHDYFTEFMIKTLCKYINYEKLKWKLFTHTHTQRNMDEDNNSSAHIHLVGFGFWFFLLLLKFKFNQKQKKRIDLSLYVAWQECCIYNPIFDFKLNFFFLNLITAIAHTQISKFFFCL